MSIRSVDMHDRKHLIPAAGVAGILLLVLITACVWSEQSSPQADVAPSATPSITAMAKPLPNNESTGSALTKPAPLDLATLEKRLRETGAIGLFTKIALKNQVDDLVDQFRALHQRQGKPAELRQPYDLLFLKVLTLLQDGDPPLAKTIVASREAIWGILSDPAKFSTI